MIYTFFEGLCCSFSRTPSRQFLRNQRRTMRLKKGGVRARAAPRRGVPLGGSGRNSRSSNNERARIFAPSRWSAWENEATGTAGSHTPWKRCPHGRRSSPTARRGLAVATLLFFGRHISGAAHLGFGKRKNERQGLSHSPVAQSADDTASSLASVSQTAVLRGGDMSVENACFHL